MSIHPDLPEVCYAFIEDDAKIVCILRGQLGYSEPTNLPADLAGKPVAAKAWVDRKNDAMGVTPAQREAMVAASMFGWHFPLADPDNFTSARPYTAA